MKLFIKNLGLLLLAAVLMTPTLHANADDAENRKIEMKAEVRTETGIKANIRNLFEGKKEDQYNAANREKNNASSTRKDTQEMRINKASNLMASRFTAAALRLETLANRIDSRIVKMKAEGKTTVEAESQITIARKEIDEARIGIRAIASTTQSAITSKTFENLRALSESIKEDTKAAHAALVKAVVSIKPGKLDVRASTTVQIVQ